MKSQEDKPKTIVNMTDRIEEEEGKSEEKISGSQPSDEVAISLEEISEIPEGTPIKRPFWRTGSPPSREQILTTVAFWGVILLGAILRFWNLGDRPLHHDESLHGYFSLQLLHNNIEQWASCFQSSSSCYHYDPLLHGPFQFHAIAVVYLIAQLLGVADHGVNTTTVRIAAALLGTVIVGLPYFLRHYLGNIGAWLACFLLAVSPSMVYFSRFAREDIYMACFTLLLVVAVAQYMQTRRMFWFIMAAAAFSLSYATKEATFLTIAVFGSFFGAVIAWELGPRAIKWMIVVFSVFISFMSGHFVLVLLRRSSPFHFRSKRLATNGEETHQAGGSLAEKLTPRTSASIALILYFIALGVFAKWLFGRIKDLSIYITANAANTKIADAFVTQLKDKTQLVIPWLGILLSAIVLFVLVFEQKEEKGPVEKRDRWSFRYMLFAWLIGPFNLVMTTFILFFWRRWRRGLARWVDPEKQPWLDTIVTISWQHLFFGFVIGWTIFMVLFTALFTNIPNGIGDGIWQGLYYWIQQQEVARGGQPWYYYLMLIPLYEQIGVVFGLVGIVYSLLHPSRFRLFLVYWFVGNVFIYSWAAEKMPWLMIHMMMPLILLAAIGLQPFVLTLLQIVKGWRTALLARQTKDVLKQVDTLSAPLAPDMKPDFVGKKVRVRFITSVLGTLLAVFTLVLTLQNMFQVVYVDPASGPHEMMIYVQTTYDVNTIMAKIDTLDRKMYGGKHQMPIAVMNDALWPFAWYLRDYSFVCFSFPSTACPTSANWPVIIAGGDDLPSIQAQYGQQYAYHQYEMRSQWDQGYMPPPCIGTPTNPCAPQQYTGVGPLPWLSYGNYPPHPGQFDLGLIAKNVWQWWWHRTPFGGIDTGYGMALLIRKDLVHLGMQP